jgi:L-ascorbate metabolism protein UlaG (beta-lactamase superfamily)
MKSTKNTGENYAEQELQIIWLGHAAFLLTSSAGTRVLLDPYRAPDAGAYAPIDVPADVVLVSHLNPKYHSHWEAASGNPVRLNGLDLAGRPNGRDVLGTVFRAVQVWESPERKTPVSMPYFEIDGIKVCHSGDLGHALSPAQAAPLVGIDVFLAVAGGPPTVSLPDMKAAIDLIQPKIVIPMHYQNGKINLPIRPVDDFLALFEPSQIVRRDLPILTFSADTLPQTMQIIVLPSAN